ncbi:DUF6545 domain-containing protein [Streptomyces sp. NPDC089919]|uniref:DUF6545 domain-containing protein n=1 Tax=Streptomyces sp. NPDC089919 TaxID=3155188 RepID=UPI00343AC174
MHEGVNYYVPATAMGIALLAKLPALLRGWRNPMVRTVNTVLLTASACFAFSAPPTITVVNRLTGVSNFSAPLVYCILCAFSCACLVLMENWRADSRVDARTRRRIRIWMACYCLVILAIIGCFTLGEAPSERLRDFDTYYADTPFIREMIVLYLLAHIVAACATTIVCCQWALEISRDLGGKKASSVGNSLQAGLVVLAVGFVCNLIFGVLKLTGVLMHSAALNEGVAPFISLDGMVVTFGFLLPVFGPWLTERVWRPCRTFAALSPLRALIRPPAGAGSVLLTAPWYAGPEQRLMYRMTTINDWLLELRGYCADGVREDARRAAEAGGAGEREAAVVGLAAMFETAVRDRDRGAPADPAQSAAAIRSLRAAEAEHGDLLVRISRALPAAAGAAVTVPEFNQG